jgi:2-methylcitrate dehydratase PrpD
MDKERLMEDVTFALSEYVSTANFSDISPYAVHVAKMSTLDTLGAMLAGSTAEGMSELVGLTKDWGGTEQAHLVGFGFKVPAPLAALCNGSMARAREIDDCLDFLPVHPSASTIAALLSFAELRGDMSGRDFLTALGIGQDIIVRMGLTLRKNLLLSGRGNMFDIFGPTAALAKAIGFGPKEVQNTLGISYSFAIGDGQSLLDGAWTVRLQQGLLAQGALLSVLLGAKRFTGPQEFLLGKHGYLNAFEPDPYIEYLTKDLGKTYYGERISFKPYSACRGTHEAIELALRFYMETGGNVASIRHIKVSVSPEIHKLLASPAEVKIKPESSQIAQFSIQFTVAAALIRGDFFLKELEKAAIEDDTILNLAGRVHVEPDPSLRTDFAVGRTVMEIELDKHPTWKGEIDGAFGSPSHPMDFEGLTKKFMKCVPYARYSPKEADLRRLIEMVLDLENVSNISKLMTCIC